MAKEITTNQIVDIAAEQEFLGKFLNGGNDQYLSQAVELVSPNDFAESLHADIWSAVAAMVNRGVDHVDATTVYTELKQSGKSIDIVDLIELSSNYYGYAMEIGQYIADLSLRRTVIQKLGMISRNAQDVTEPISGVLSQIKDVADMVTADDGQGFKTTGEIMMELLRRAEDFMNGKRESGYPSGFECIDKRGGLLPTDLTIVAGESSMGKTSFALAIAQNACKAGVPIAVYSMEMSLSQLSARLVAMNSESLNGSDILTRALSREEFDGMYRVAIGLSSMPMFFDDSSVHTLDKLKMSIRKIVRKYGVKGVVVDYLQLLTLGGKSINNRVEELAIIARSLKNLAKELNIFIIALSQLNRPKDGANPLPTMRRLRGSGEIEEAADNIYFVYRASQYGIKYPSNWEDYPTEGTALVIIGKARNASIGEDLVEFVANNTLFRDFNKKPLRAASASKQDEEIERLLSSGGVKW